MRKIKKTNNNDHDSNLCSERSELSSERSESSKKTSITDDYEVQTSFEYLKDNKEDFFGGYPNIFDSDLKNFFDYIAFKKEKYIGYNLLSEEILLSSGDVLNFFNKYHDLYDFWTDALLDTSLDNIKSQQVNFLKDLLNGFSVYKNISKPEKKSAHEAKDLYLKLLGNLSQNVNDILVSSPKDKNNLINNNLIKNFV